MWKQWVKLAALIVAAAIAQHFANMLAFAERGYEAMGSELFIFPLVMIIGGYFLGLLEVGIAVDYNDESEDDFYDTGSYRTKRNH